MLIRRLIATGVFLVLIPVLFIVLLILHEKATSHLNAKLAGVADTPTPVINFLTQGGTFPPLLGIGLTAFLAFGLFDVADVSGAVQRPKTTRPVFLPSNNPVGFIFLRLRRYGMVTLGPLLSFLFGYCLTQYSETGPLLLTLSSDFMWFLLAFVPTFGMARRPLDWTVGNVGWHVNQYHMPHSGLDVVFKWLFGYNTVPEGYTSKEKASPGMVLLGFLLVCVLIPPVHGIAAYIAFHETGGKFFGPPTSLAAAICVGVITFLAGFWQWWDVFARRGPKLGGDYYPRKPRAFCLAVAGIHLLGLPAVVAGGYFVGQSLPQKDVAGYGTFIQVGLLVVLICRWFAPICYSVGPTRGEPLQDAGVPA